MRYRDGEIISRWIVLIGTMLLATGVARASSTYQPITPATIRHLPRVAVTVHATAMVKGEQFQIVVKPRSAVYRGFGFNYSQTDGNLEDERFLGQGKAFPCLVATTKQKNGVTVFDFTLPYRYLAHARFEFGWSGYNEGHGLIMPSGNYYWFKPSDFVHSGASKRLALI